MKRIKSITKIVFYLSIINGTVSCLGLSSIAGDESTKKRVKEEAPKAWKRISDFYNGTEFTVNTHGSRVDPHNNSSANFVLNQTVKQFNSNIRIDCDLIVEEKYQGQFNRHEKTYSQLLNSDYTAELIQRQKDGWILEKCQAREIVSNGWFIDAQPSLRIVSHHLPFCLYDTGLIPAGNQSALVLHDAWVTPEIAQEERITAEFKFAMRGPNREFELNEHFDKGGGKLLVEFAPKREWCITNVVCENVLIGIESKMEFFFNDDGFHPVRVLASERKMGGSYHETYEETFTKPHKTVFPSNEFRLPSFGLPEPSHFVKSDLGLFYLIFGSMIVLCLGLYCSRVFFGYATKNS